MQSRDVGVPLTWLGPRFVIDPEWLYRFDSEWFSPQGVAES
jgi:hypothetical protein